MEMFFCYAAKNMKSKIKCKGKQTSIQIIYKFNKNFLRINRYSIFVQQQTMKIHCWQVIVLYIKSVLIVALFDSMLCVLNIENDNEH